MKRWLKILITVVYLLGVFYLITPEPVIPNLKGALKSTEPGDTVQMPGVWAYYTNLSRREAIDFYQEAYSRSWFLNLPLPTYILNHPPEYARETIKDTLKTNFYEELVHPLKESLFISGWTPKEDKVYLARHSENPITSFLVEGKEYPTKITLYHVVSPRWVRLLVWTGIMAVFVLIGLIFKSIIVSPWRAKR